MQSNSINTIKPLYFNNTTSVNNTGAQNAQAAPIQVETYGLPFISPALREMILAQQNAKVTAQPPQAVQAVTAAQDSKAENYKNSLKSMLVNNEANIMAVNLRTMSAIDKDGNDLIQGDEEHGTFINAVNRLDELKDLGINTLHILPFHPPGKIEALGTAGSLYAPGNLLEIDPVLRDKNDPRSIEEQCKYFIDECHKRGIKVMLDLPSCVSVDFANAHPELMAKTKDGQDKTPQGWMDIRMFRVWDDEDTRTLNPHLLELHKKYVDMAVDLGMDGIRADVARAKPVEFWNVIIPYSHSKDPEFGWLAETYTYEDASPQLNMPHDRPYDQLRAGFDSYYGQYHIYNQWNKADDLYDYVIENLAMSNNSEEGPKSLIGSFATHDDESPMHYGGAPWVMLTTGLQSTLPQLNTYFVDGAQTGDYYRRGYEHATVPEGDTMTDSRIATNHTGRLDIFNLSRKPGGNFPEISEFMKGALALKNGEFKDAINKGSFIPLETGNKEVIAYIRHLNGKTLLVVANRNVNERSKGTIEIPGLKTTQGLNNLVPALGETSYLQVQEDGKLQVDLGTSRFHAFEIDTPDIEKAGLTMYKQNFDKAS